MNASRAAYFEAIKAAGPSRDDSLARITLLAKLLDSAFYIPGLNRRVGLDAALGLIPHEGELEVVGKRWGPDSAGNRGIVRAASESVPRRRGETAGLPRTGT